MANYIPEQVISQLNKKSDIRIVDGTVWLLTGNQSKNDVGIKSKGKIDFLTNYCGFNLLLTRRW